MSKKNMESTRELMGTKEVTNYSVRTYRNDELVYFLNQPCGAKTSGEGCKLLGPYAGADGYCKRVSVNYPYP